MQTTARVIPGGPFASGIPAGGSGTATLQQFDVLNLETGDFDADFTGSLVSADQPVVVFPGSEASDAPEYQNLADRYCCADHLEHQTPPLRTVGKSYVLAKMPNRTSAVIAAGADIGEIQEVEYYRVVAAATGTTHVTTTLPAPWDAFDLNGQGDFQTIPSLTDFVLEREPAGDGAAGAVWAAGRRRAQRLSWRRPEHDVPRPASEQWRTDYVMLTPNKYVFDYLVIVAPSNAPVYVDALKLDATNSDVTPSDGLNASERGSPTPPFWTYRYQLSYPIIDPNATSPNNILPGKQNDGVHHIQSDAPVGVMAYGFDSYVSYAYAGGTQLTVLGTQ